MIVLRSVLRRLAPAMLFLAPTLARAESSGKVSVAAAANLAHVIGALDAEFTRTHPDIAVAHRIGASGGLLSQIENGAPFDVFLSADVDYPRRLAADGCAERDSLVVFATGKLALVTSRPGFRPDGLAQVVGSDSVRRIAIANPRLAPYGRAALEALEALGLRGAAEPKLVYGESVVQAAQLAASGNADAGIVALSLVRTPGHALAGAWVEVPAGLYHPIAQGAILTARGARNPAARIYLAFLHGPQARKIIEQFGYGLP
jgi:molybdate transport system substrate-binding protein